MRGGGELDGDERDGQGEFLAAEHLKVCYRSVLESPLPPTQTPILTYLLPHQSNSE